MSDYHDNLRRLHYLIDKRGELTSNLSRSEQAEYSRLVDWYLTTQHITHTGGVTVAC